MRYGSVCSGIEAATVAWHGLGWEPAWFSEIEKFPCKVLAHHYPNVPNFGDMTRFQEWPDGAIDLLVGGTPCQSFSVAGLRKGLADSRGNLMLTYLGIADRYRPRWLVWENVPGVLSSNAGKDFGALLGGLGELGYGFAYRVLDAQYFGVAQRRRRVFVVGYLGDWRRAAAVLFERHSLQGHPAPRRKAGEGAARGFETGPSGGGFTDLTPTLDCRAQNGPIQNQLGAGIAIPIDSMNCLGKNSDSNNAFGIGQDGDPAPTLSKGHSRAVAMSVERERDIERDIYRERERRHSPCSETLIAHTLRGGGFDASEDGTGRGTPLVPVAFNNRGREGGAQIEVDPDGLANIRAASGGSSRTMVGALTANAYSGGATGRPEGAAAGHFVPEGMAVRRLTPRECERLQGFPDDYTAIPGAADAPRYKALGNSMAVPCMRWIGERIQMVTELTPTPQDRSKPL